MIVTITSIAICTLVLITTNRRTLNNIDDCLESFKSIPQKIEQLPSQIERLRPKFSLKLKLNVKAKAGQSTFRRFVNKRKVLFFRKKQPPRILN